MRKQAEACDVLLRCHLLHGLDYVVAEATTPAKPEIGNVFHVRFVWVALALFLSMPTIARAEDSTAFDEGSFVLQASGSYVAGSAVFHSKFASGLTGEFGVGY